MLPSFDWSFFSECTILDFKSPPTKTPNVLQQIKVLSFFSASFYIKVHMSSVPFPACPQICPGYQVQNLNLKSYNAAIGRWLKTSILSQVKIKFTENWQNADYQLLYMAIILPAPNLSKEKTKTKTKTKILSKGSNCFLHFLSSKDLNIK